jgi:TPR repeat protein
MKVASLALALFVLLAQAGSENFISASQKDCQNGNAKACFELGTIYEDNKRFKKASEFYQKSCQMGCGHGCNNLGTFYYNGRPFKKDIQKVISLYKEACKKGSSIGCRNLGLMFTKHRRKAPAFRHGDIRR